MPRSSMSVRKPPVPGQAVRAPEPFAEGWFGFRSGITDFRGVEQGRHGDPQAEQRNPKSVKEPTGGSCEIIHVS